MHLKFTQKTLKKLISSVFMTALLFCFLGGAVAQPYINGTLSTGTTATGGTVAPAGFTWSELQGTNTGLGSGANITAGFTIADDFTVPVGQTWNITKITFFAYSTGYVSATTSPFNDTRVQIFNTNPSIGTPTPVFGNLTTNRLLTSSKANIYRIGNATPDQNREIWKIEATVNTSLTAGTYWIEWQHGTIATVTSNFSPTKTVVGQPTQAGNNALQHTIAGNTWAALTDVGGPQDMPFQIDYTPTGTACTAVSPGVTTASPSIVCPTIPFNLSVATPGSGVGLSYQWQRSTDNITYTDIATATAATLSTSQTAATWYRLRVTCGTNAPLFSTPVQVTMSTACYCTPTTINCNFNDVITNVTFAGINNTSACSANGYTNYTASVAPGTAIAGATTPMSVTVGPGGTEYVGVWIDYNQNGTFETTEFTLLGSGNGVTINGNIIIPSNATLGTTRMRVRLQYNTPVLNTQSCAQTSTFGEVEDYNVTIAPCIPLVLTSQPVNATIACGGNATFSVISSGSSPSFQWQFRQNATAIWQNVPNSAPYSNVTTNTLNITNASVSISGYQYRVIYTGACAGPDASNAATLTVNSITIPITPTSINYCPGGAPILITVPNSSNTVTFTNNTPVAVPDASATGAFSNIAVSGIPVGATITKISVNFNITHPYVGDLVVNLKSPSSNATSGILNLVGFLNGGTGTNSSADFINTTVASDGVTILSGAPAPRTGIYAADGLLIPGGPTNGVANVVNWATLLGTPNANGNWGLYLADGGTGDLGTLNSWSITITYGAAPATAIFSPTTGLFTNAAGTIPYTGTAVTQVYTAPATSTTYTAQVSTATCSGGTSTINVNTNTVIGGTATLPVAGSVCANASTTLTLGGITSGTGFTYQWQVNSVATPTVFTNITNGGIYTGATSTALTITNPPITINGLQYRIIVSSPACGTSSTSNTLTLSVNPVPVVVISAAPNTFIQPGTTATLTAAVSSATTPIAYQWFRNGIAIPGATANTYVADVNGLGAYTVRVNDANLCNAVSSTPVDITLSASASNTLYIYPSPNSGSFQVRYYNANASATINEATQLNVYDSKGSRVFTQRYTIVGPYTQMRVNLGVHNAGIYRVELTNNRGERIKTGSVIVF